MQHINMIILGAGQGTRMKSTLPKILHPLAGLPLVHHVCILAERLKTQTSTIVVSPDMQEVQDYLKQNLPNQQIAFQAEPKGTGHAVRCAVEQVDLPAEYTMIHFADTPLVEDSLIESALQKLLERKDYGVCIIAFECLKKNAYGRVLLKENGVIDRIVEWKNATEQERQTTLCNSGLMLFRTDALKKVIEQLQPSELTQEYYLTDVVPLLREFGFSAGVLIGSEDDLRGINSQQELAECELLLQQKYRHKFMKSGVRLMDPSSAYFSYDTQIDADVVIEPHVFFGTNVRIAQGAHIHAFSYIQGSEIAKGVHIGPFARLRPGAILKENSRVGNFVEIKNTTLGVGSKANHLSYLGDAEIGTQVNIGAGAITCNYDGYRKSKTIIGDNVFIGSNSALVAPVHIGAGAFVAAGSTITKNVSADALSVARAPQKDLPEGSKKFRLKALQEKVA